MPGTHRSRGVIRFNQSTPSSLPRPMGARNNVAKGKQVATSHAERKVVRQRLLQHKWVLDQEHERRFRRGMGAIMGNVVEFERTNT